MLYLQRKFTALVCLPVGNICQKHNPSLPQVIEMVVVSVVVLLE